MGNDLVKAYSPSSPEDAALEAMLEGLVAMGRAAWPDVRLEPAVFAHHLGERTMGDLAALGAIHAADLYLACGCKEGDAAALAAFERTHLARVPEFLARMRPARDFCEDVRQIVSEKLLVGSASSAPKIAEYSGRGSLSAWLRVTTVRTALNLRQQRHEETEESGDAVARVLAARVDPELDIIRERYGPVFTEALRVAFAALSTDQRVVLRLHAVKGLTGDQIAATLQIHRATVVRWIARAREDVLTEACRHLRTKLGVSGSEVESLVAILRSQIDVSLSQLLDVTTT